MIELFKFPSLNLLWEVQRKINEKGKDADKKVLPQAFVSLSLSVSPHPLPIGKLEALSGDCM